MFTLYASLIVFSFLCLSKETKTTMLKDAVSIVAALMILSATVLPS